MLLCITPPNLRLIAEILKRVRVVTPSLRPGQNLSRKITKFLGTRKNWPSIAILSSDLLHGTVHHPTKFQDDSWNPQRVRVGMSYGADRRTGGRSLWPTTIPVGPMAAYFYNTNEMVVLNIVDVIGRTRIRLQTAPWTDGHFRLYPNGQRSRGPWS